MKDLSKKLHKKIEKLEDGKLKLDEIEELTSAARELYERLVVIRHKAYEKFGEPNGNKDEPKAEVKVEEKKETPETEKKSDDESAFDFSEGIQEVEQPAFDFAMETSDEQTEEEEEASQDEIYPEDADIKNVAPKEEETPSDTFPEGSEVKSKKDIFKESHVEKHEPEDENSLNQKLANDSSADDSLRKKLQRTPVKDLKDEISIAKKFEYITFMFDGKNELYEEAIDVLNNCEDGDEAKDKLNEYSTKYSWDLENKSIIKFVELVERRYL